MVMSFPARSLAATGDITLHASTSSNVFGVDVDAAGNVYYVQPYTRQVFRVDAGTGAITVIAGTGGYGFSGDGGLATSATLVGPWGVAVDATGNVYISDRFNHRIRRVDATTGIISTVAGNGLAGFSGDGGSATSSRLYYPWGIDVDADGNIYIADVNNRRIRRVDAATGIITTVANTSSYGNPRDVAVDSSGNVFASGSFGVRRIDASTSAVSTISTLGYVYGVAVDGANNVFYVRWRSSGLNRWDAGTATSTQVSTIAYPVLGVGIGYNGNVYVSRWHHK